VESEPGKGSTFRLELVVEAVELNPSDALREVEWRVVLEPDQPPVRVLVIEDDPANRLLLTRVLESAGFQVRAADNGGAGINEFSSWRPHFIWLDIQLPGMNGIEVAARIRELAGGRDVKIAALTASVFNEERNTVLAAGIDDFVRKPYRAQSVFECMEKLLGVRYVRSVAAVEPVSQPTSSSLTQVAVLPEELKSQLLQAVLLLDKERIAELIQDISVVNPDLAAELSRRADAFEFTPIMRALQAGGGSVSAGKILVVDDSEDSRGLLSEVLTAEGYDVRPADSGELALAAVAASPPGS